MTLPVEAEESNVSFIVKRASEEELTFAVIKARVTKKTLQNEVEFRKALIQAVTFWHQNDPEGQQAWQYSSGDFNLGDLAGWSNEGLTKALEAVGIHDFSLEVESHDYLCTHWTYDTVLHDQDQ